MKILPKLTADWPGAPTDPWLILEPQDQEIGECYVVHTRRATDFEAFKVVKGPVGCGVGLELLRRLRMHTYFDLNRKFCLQLLLFQSVRKNDIFPPFSQGTVRI